MKYLIVHSDASIEEKTFCDTESEATAIIEQKIRDGASQESITVYVLQPVGFQVERVPVAKISEHPFDDAADPEVPDFRAEPEAASENGSESENEAGGNGAEGAESANPFLSEQVFSLDSLDS